MNCIRFPKVPRSAGRSSPMFQPSFVGIFIALALLLSGCAGLTGPNGLGHYVLVVCKITPEQQAAGQQRANRYFSQVASGKKARPARRYIAVQTLDPNKKQAAKYAAAKDAAEKKAKSAGQSVGPEWVDPSQLRCVMVYDVVTHESVGTNCYVVGSLPTLGETTTFDTYSAEFVATSNDSSVKTP